MRVLILAAALLAAACSVETSSSGDGDAAPHGYRLEVRADKDNQIYLITAPDGRATGGMVSGGQSTLLNAHAMELLARVPDQTNTTATTTDGDHHVSFHAPGVSFEASGNDDDAEKARHAAGSDDNDHGQAHMTFNFGGHSMQIDAQGNSDKGDDRAHVVINGADAKTARDFINNSEDLSRPVKQQMLQAIGL